MVTLIGSLWRRYANCQFKIHKVSDTSSMHYCVYIYIYIFIYIHKHIIYTSCVYIYCILSILGLYMYMYIQIYIYNCIYIYCIVIVWFLFIHIYIYIFVYCCIFYNILQYELFHVIIYNILFFYTVDGCEILHHLGPWLKHVETSKAMACLPPINWRRISQPSTVCYPLVN